MSDGNGRISNPPPPEPPPTLAYHAPAHLHRRPIAGAFAILSAIVCAIVGIICAGMAVEVAADGNFLGAGMGAFYAVAFLIASITLARTSAAMIRGTQDDDGSP